MQRPAGAALRSARAHGVPESDAGRVDGAQPGPRSALHPAAKSKAPAAVGSLPGEEAEARARKKQKNQRKKRKRVERKAAKDHEDAI